MEDSIDSQLDATLEALRELEKWKRRKEELENEIKNVNRQVAYYETIVREMKEKISPENFRKLLDLS
jgi:predicted  nucleic acid-binding Zn-ribbon protein